MNGLHISKWAGEKLRTLMAALCFVGVAVVAFVGLPNLNIAAIAWGVGCSVPYLTIRYRDSATPITPEEEQ